MRISELFDNYMRDVVLFEGQSTSTAGHVRRTKNRLLDIFGDIDIADLNFDKVIQFKKYIEQSCGQNGTRQFIIKLRNVLRYCRQHGIACIDYDSIRLPKRQNTEIPYCTPEEVNKMIEASMRTKITVHRIRDRAIIALLFSSGLRLHELCNLNIDQLRDGRFTVIGKNGKMRLCFYDNRTAVYLSEYIKTRREGYKTYWTYGKKVTSEVRRYYPPDTNEALFINSITGTRIRHSAVQLLVKNAAELAGLKHVHPHMLRHGYAVNLAHNGMALHSLQRLMGHESLSTTGIYLNVTYPQLEEDYRKFIQTNNHP